MLAKIKPYSTCLTLHLEIPITLKLDYYNKMYENRITKDISEINTYDKKIGRLRRQFNKIKEEIMELTVGNDNVLDETTHAIEVGVENKSEYVLKLNDLNRDANMLTSLRLITCMSYPTARKHMCVYYIGTDVYMQTYNNHFYRNLIVI